MLRPKFRHILPIVAGLALIGVLAFSPDLLAQSDSLSEVGDASGLGSEDPRIIVAQLIRTFLTVLGILGVLIVLYGGFTWMTAGGNQEKLERAKKILVRGGIGLAIILMSWSITTFVITALMSASGTGNGSGSGDGSGGAGGGLGGGGSSSFYVTDFSPDSAVSIRNIVLTATFNKTIDEDSVDAGITVTNSASGEVVAGTVEVSGNRMTFTPSAACPSPNEDRFCFDTDTAFTVAVQTDLRSESGLTISCSDDSCTSSFTSGSVVDTEDPVAEITNPEGGDGVEAGSAELIQVHATDDSQVSVADFAIDRATFDSVGATGDDLSDVTIESTWDTTSLTIGQEYEVFVEVTDIAGNTDGVSIDVIARGAWCFNDEMDEDYGETGIDCGGDSSSDNYCGACDGSSCVEDSDCSSGSCVDGMCTTLPEIESFSPASGAVGTFVTIQGSGFGIDGTVTFVTEDGSSVEAEIPSCSDGWSDTQIIVEVPEGAVDGPITVTTDDDLADSTSDDAGLRLDDYDVNDTVRPKLCSLAPDEGESAAGTTLSGFDFGDSQGSSTVAFGSTGAGSYVSWEDVSIDVTVPALEDGDYDVVVTVDGVTSNAVNFTVEDDTTGDPVITGIEPSEGAIGDYITLTGENFGALEGTVRLLDSAGNEAVASVEFPEACEDNYWGPTEITVIVPEDFQDESSLAAGAYTVSVIKQDGAESDAVDFTVTDGDPSPGICAIDPEYGLAGTEVTIYGERLGSREGTVKFFDGEMMIDEDGEPFYEGVEATVVTDGWSPDEVTVTVPDGFATGPVTVTSSSGDESNSLNFEKREGGDVDTAAEPAAYGWYFSTGDIPATPEIIVECSEETVSAVPNTRYTNGVCLQAVVYAEFSTLMNEGTIDDALLIEQCTAGGDQPCDTTTDITANGALTVASSTTRTSFTWEPSSDFSASTTYRITVSDAALSALSQPLAADVSWEFETSATAETCEVDSVRVSPSAATITEQYATERFEAVPTDGCVVVDGDDYNWSWYVYTGVASLTGDATCPSRASDCTLVQGNAEGEVDVTATETASDVTGSADLTVAFTDPYVDQYWPSCAGACSNGQVGASFNTAVLNSTLQTEGAVTMYICENELCAVGADDEHPSYAVAGAECETDDEGVTSCERVNITPNGDLTEGTYYRVVIDGAVSTRSLVALTRTNYHGDFSWIFRVKEGDAICAVERIEVSPQEAFANEIGDRQTFTVDAYGQPDACSVAGQLLNPTEYDWTFNAWTDDGDSTAIDVAVWTPDAEVDTDLSDVPDGCTASCIPAGSTAYDAICGDGVVDAAAGEECESSDGSTIDGDGDGCSSSCLWEGSATTCGDGDVDTHEECDDSNTTSGDGCSSVCLNEGSREVGATCGNNDLAFTQATGGEDCDDGNVANGDGCSSICLHEGSLTLTEVGGAVCGDNEITTPYETCDDGGVVDGDGCSSSCLREGANGTYGTCGADGTERGAYGEGEDCDGEEWCTSECTYNGSSASYEIPSFCGDGEVGLGEFDEVINGDRVTCESSGGDTRTDAIQLAEIDGDAAQEVDLDTNIAVASMTVTTSDVSAGATYTLSCSATTDEDCSEPKTIGIGDANCCSARPTAVLYPMSDDGDVCRNSSIYGLFTKEMNTGSFLVTDATTGTATPRMYLVLDTSTTDDGLCPYDADALTLGRDLPWYQRAWFSLRRVVTGYQAGAAPAAGECVLPVTGFAQEQIDGSYKVRMRYAQALEPNATYTLRIEVDSSYSDGVTSGVLSADGVAIYDEDGVIEETFTTGSDICTLDEIVVEDTDEDSPGYFSQTGETHTFTATAYTHNGSTRQEIESIDDVYSWEWEDWDEDAMIGSVVDVAQGTASGTEDEATVEASGDNGEAEVVAAARIVDDVVGDTGGACSTTTSQSCSEDSECPTDETCNEGDLVLGSERVTVYLCENTWPDIDTQVFPWSDDADSDDYGAEEGTAWMNFSTYYCRDSGEDDTTDDDMPGVDVVYAPDYSTTDDIYKEYFFEVEGTNDAIGIRVMGNDEYLSPANWFEAKGFSGSPQVTTVDGFQAVTEGRTTYIAAPNERDSVLYSNIYVISYNEGASTETIDIYNQMVENLQLAINVSGPGLCVESDGTTLAEDADGGTVACDDDSDCTMSDGETCTNEHAQLQRDTKRLADMTTVALLIEEYGEENGRCSATVAQSCTEDSDCPGSETCDPVVPTLSSGTHVRGLGASAWTSWGDLLGAALGDNALVSDPLNYYASCGAEGGAFASYDGATCVDETSGTYTCPEGSHVYHYRVTGDEVVTLAADLEYVGGTWKNPIETDAADAVNFAVSQALSGSVAGFTATAFCSSTADAITTYGSVGSCGDGVINTSIDSDGDGTVDAMETCEIGDTGGTATACTTSTGAAGYQSESCNSTCSGWTPDTTAACVPASCGDGIVDLSRGEDCDDGALNGRYGYCSSTCRYVDAFYCGDGSLGGSEVCDCGAPGESTIADPADSRPYGGTSYTCVMAEGNGVYSDNPYETCAWDCSGPASYCGDGVIDSAEQCDGDVESYAEALCADGTPCSSDTACTDGSSCGDGGAACPEVRVCTAGDASLDGTACSQDSDCDSTPLYYTHYVVTEITYETTDTVALLFVDGDEECAVAGSTYDEYDAEDGETITFTCAAVGVCVGEDTSAEDYLFDDGDPCTAGSQCSSGTCEIATNNDGVCSDIEYQTYRTRTCNDDGASGESCTWDVVSTGLLGVECQALGSCGDGVVDANEACDDGNSDSTDSCTNECTANVCGDGYLYLGEEQCDEGSANGGSCSSAYGSTCTACSTTCRYVTSSGDFCGDGAINGDEFCDAYDMPAYYTAYLTYEGMETGEEEANLFVTESCDAAGETYTVSDEGDPFYGVEFTCSQIGVCNGEDPSYDGYVLFDAGDECTNDSQCSSGDCVMPTCADDCNSMCPDTYESTSLLMETNEPGSTPSSSISLYAYSESGEANIPNAATITFPECRAGATLTADISLDGVEPTEFYVVFVTDTSGSMAYSFDGATTSGVPTADQRITTAKDVLGDAIETLYDAAPEYMHIALVQYDSCSGSGCVAAYEQTSGDGGPAEFSDSDGESALQSTITTYYVAGGGTETDDGLTMAKELLDDQTSSRTSNVRKIVVLLSDGEATDMGAAGTAATTLKEVDMDEDGVGDYELYTVALTSVPELITSMAGWSGQWTSASTTSDIDYAYDGDTAEALAEAYESIVASIAQPTIVIVSSDGTTTYTTTTEFEEGSGVTLPWPEGFACDTGAEQELPIRMTFPGEGQIEISNVRFEYCAP